MSKEAPCRIPFDSIESFVVHVHYGSMRRLLSSSSAVGFEPLPPGPQADSLPSLHLDSWKQDFTFSYLSSTFNPYVSLPISYLNSSRLLCPLHFMLVVWLDSRKQSRAAFSFVQQLTSCHPCMARCHSNRQTIRFIFLLLLSLVH